MGDITDLLSGEHHQIREALSELQLAMENDEAPLDTLRVLRNMLSSHIFFEENYLFDTARNPENAAMINGLEAEHGGILQLLDKIEDYLVRGDAARSKDRAEGLERVLEAHDVSEMDTVYKVLDDRVDLKSVISARESITVPAGWKSKVLAKYDRKR